MPGKFRFSRRSEKNLEGVKRQLVAVVRRALELRRLISVLRKACAVSIARNSWLRKGKARP